MQLVHHSSWVPESGSRINLGKELDQLKITPSFQSYASLLRECWSPSQGKLLHQHLVATGSAKNNVVLSNLLIQMHGRCRNLQDAKAVFDSLQGRNVFSWTILIAAYAQNGHPVRALRVFMEMDNEGVQPNEVTVISILGVLATQEDLSKARNFHSRIFYTRFHSDAQVNTALIHMYGRCKSPRESRRIFDSMTSRNAVTWNAMIAAYAHNGQTQLACEIFRLMTGTDNASFVNQVTFLNVLSALTSAEDLGVGKAVHSRVVGSGFESDVKVGTAIVSMYGKCGSLKDACAVFESMPVRNVVTWNAVISVNAQSGCGREALGYFWRMNQEGVRPNSVTLASVLEGCANAGAISQGRLIHSRVPWQVCESKESEIVLWTSLLNMYGKCGSLREARSVFCIMPYRNIITWNTIMAAYAQQGFYDDVLEIYSVMLQEGVRPNPITFVNVLYVCSHAGRLILAIQHFASMKHDHGIDPDLEHFGCVVDLLGRLGRLKEAEDTIKLMPLKDEAVWLALLNACKMHDDSRRGAEVAGRVFNMDLKDSAPYVLLSGLMTHIDQGGISRFQNE